jgi:hypothetical protein
MAWTIETLFEAAVLGEDPTVLFTAAAPTRIDELHGTSSAHGHGKVEIVRASPTDEESHFDLTRSFFGIATWDFDQALGVVLQAGDKIQASGRNVTLHGVGTVMT